MKSNHYTHSLYYKLLIGYLIFGLLGFITIATISSEMTYHHLVERESEVLYDEATMIATGAAKPTRVKPSISIRHTRRSRRFPPICSRVSGS